MFSFGTCAFSYKLLFDKFDDIEKITYYSIHNLRDNALFSSFDFSNAFNSVKITEESKPYTRFAADHGYVDFLRLPTGMVFLPASFDEYAQKVVHYEADLDVEGNLI